MPHSRAVQRINRRAAIIHPLVAVTVATAMGLLALLGHMHLDVNHWLSRTVVAVPAPSVLDVFAGVGLVAILVGATLVSAARETQR